MRTMLVLMCLTTFAWAQQRRQDQESPGSRAGKLSPQSASPEVSIRGGLEIAYDDNILELNKRQLDRLEAGSNPERFRIDEPEDFVYSVWAEVRIKGRVIGDPTQAGFKIQPYSYQNSSIANYEEYEIFMRQDIGRHEAGIEYQLEWDAYLRELEIVIPSAPNLWESARYSEHDLEGYYRHRISAAVSVRPSFGYRVRDFDSPFGFRDQEGFFVALQSDVALGRGLSAFVRYEYSDIEAAASFGEPDTSHREHEFELGGAWELLDKRLEISLSYRIGIREYTTSNTPADDPSHVDREDDRRRLVLWIRARVLKNWTADAQYIRRDIDSDRPFDNPATTSEPGDSTRNVFVFGITMSF